MRFREILRKGIILGIFGMFLATGLKGVSESNSKVKKLNYNVKLEEVLKRGSVNIDPVSINRVRVSFPGDPKVYEWKAVSPFNSSVITFEPLGIYEDLNKNGRFGIGEYFPLSNGRTERIKVFLIPSEVLVLSEKNPHVLYSLSCERRSIGDIKTLKLKGIYRDFNRDSNFSRKEYFPIMGVRDIM
jgi:hypothetical protein